MVSNCKGIYEKEVARILNSKEWQEAADGSLIGFSRFLVLAIELKNRGSKDGSCNKLN
jgi:hypothetical protein